MSDDVLLRIDRLNKRFGGLKVTNDVNRLNC